MFGKLKGLMRKLGRLVAGPGAEPEKFQRELLGIHNVTPRERELRADAYSVKRKLGRSFFTRRLNPRTVAARVSALTSEERRIARAHGWIR